MATFDEDVLGARIVHFEQGCKALNPAEILIRTICWAHRGTDAPGSMLKLVLPPAPKIDGAERFHLRSLYEPARTEFLRYQPITATPVAGPVEQAVPRAEHFG